MKTATMSDLRKNFRRISNWLEDGHTVLIFKRGKLFARIILEPKTLLGATPSPYPLPPDIDEPVGIEWEAMK